MSKILIAAAAAALISTAAVAEEAAPKANPLGGIDFTLGADYSYNIDSENAQIELSAGAEVMNIFAGVAPTYDITGSNLDNIEFSAGYNFALTDNATITPYGEYNVDKDFSEVSKVVGVKAELKL